MEKAREQKEQRSEQADWKLTYNGQKLTSLHTRSRALVTATMVPSHDRTLRDYYEELARS